MSEELFSIFKCEKQRFKKFIPVSPPGFVHTITPQSALTLFSAIGFQNIANSIVVEIGCGEGYIVNYLLRFGASQIFALDSNKDAIDMINNIKEEAYRIYCKNSYHFQLLDFMKVNVYEFSETFANPRISIMLIGTKNVCCRLLEVFAWSHTLEIIAFMIPSSKFQTTINEFLDKYQKTFHLSSHKITIKLSQSNENRQVCILKKEKQIDSIVID
jgi:SAM-dependent methyltransferase